MSKDKIMVPTYDIGGPILFDFERLRERRVRMCNIILLKDQISYLQKRLDKLLEEDANDNESNSERKC